MITLINPELFNLTTTKEKNAKGEEYYKTVVSSSVQVKHNKTNEMFNRVITTITHETENYNDTNVYVHNTKMQNNGIRTSITSSSANSVNVNAFLIAIPFNGFLSEIKRSFQYRIYKGFVLRTDKKSIEFNGNHYKKVAYMVVVPNELLLKEDHKYHTDELKMTVDAYNLDTKDENVITILTSTDIVFKENGVSEYSVNSGEVEPVNAEDFNHKLVFPIYNPASKNTRNTNRNNCKTKQSDENLDKMIDEFNKSSNEKQKNYSKKNKKKR